MNAYTISLEKSIGYLVYNFFMSELPHVENIFKLDGSNFNFDQYAKNHYVWVCWKEGRPVGIMMAQLYGSVFNPDQKILFQDLLYVKKSTSKAAYLLMKEFIAFGQANAKIVFTCKTKHTNIKERTLKRLGFEKTEEIYRLVTGEN